MNHLLHPTPGFSTNRHTSIPSKMNTIWNSNETSLGMYQTFKIMFLFMQKGYSLSRGKEVAQ